MSAIWSLSIVQSCPKVEGQGLTCMACGKEQAVGHVSASGGPFDGRVLMLVCPTCADVPNDGRSIREALKIHFMELTLDVQTGGPGPLGSPMVWHGTHWDVMIDEC